MAHMIFGEIGSLPTAQTYLDTLETIMISKGGQQLSHWAYESGPIGKTQFIEFQRQYESQLPDRGTITVRVAGDHAPRLKCMDPYDNGKMRDVDTQVILSGFDQKSSTYISLCSEIQTALKGE